MGGIQKGATQSGSLYNKEANTYTLKEKHLTGYAQWNYKRGGMGFYDIDLMDIIASYRVEINKYIKRGTNILLQIDGKTRLLIFVK